MNNEKHYNYYVVTEDASAVCRKTYNDEIAVKQHNVIKSLLEKTGAIAYRTLSNWTGADTICELVFEYNHDITRQPYIKRCSVDRFEGKKVVSLRGKMNNKEGKAFNKVIDEANVELEKYPTFGDWLIYDYFKISHTGFGGTNPQTGGVAMLSTNTGWLPGHKQLGVSIPNEKELPLLPESFTQVTYGVFYDLLNS